eukprot:4256368-Amphidinium_carterae.3
MPNPSKTPGPRAALRALRKLSSVLLALRFSCLKLWVLRPVSKPPKSGRLAATSASKILAESHLTL